jgi:hypothetical protein
VSTSGSSSRADMRTLTRTALFLALAASAAPAAAQFRATPMWIPVDEYGVAAVGPIETPWPGSDVLILPPPLMAPPLLRPYRSLLARPAITRAIHPSDSKVVATFLGPRAAGAKADLVFLKGTDLSVGFGATPDVLRDFLAVLPVSAPNLTPVHLLPRAGGEVLAAPSLSGGYDPGWIVAVDLSTGAPVTRSWPTPAVLTRFALNLDVQRLRLSPTARALGIDDLAVSGAGEVALLLHAAAPGPGGLAGLDMFAVRVGDHVLPPTPMPWLPDGMEQGDVLGVGALDVDFDGVPDLVLSLGYWSPADQPTPRGLVWIRNTGDLAALGDKTRRWGDLRSHPDLAPLENPMTMRAFELAGGPALAVYDRAAAKVVVITSDRAARRLRTWRGDTLGVDVTELLLADVVGSPAPDLIAKGAIPNGAQALLVYPDAGDAWPELAWAAGSPGEAARGLDHAMAVDAADADGPLTVEWLTAGREDPPAATGTTWTIPGAQLCDVAADIPLRVRATDDLGVFAEVEGLVDVVLAPPSLWIAGAAPTGRLALPPGGTSAELDGEAWSGCGRAVTFTWGGTAFPPEAQVVVLAGTTWTRQAVTLPEAAYPALLAGAPEVTLSAVDEAGLASPVATLPLALDATGLVEVVQTSDRTAPEAGDVVVLRTVLRSRLSVPLARVRVRRAWGGLAPAGAPRVTGAAASRTGKDLVLDVLPPAGAEVVLEEPVRVVTPPATSDVEVRSAGGHLLTPAASAGAADPPAPGCGCGAPDAGGALALLGALLARRRSRRAT